MRGLKCVGIDTIQNMPPIDAIREYTRPAYRLRFDVCQKCGSHNWTATSYGAVCLACDWEYRGNIYLDEPRRDSGVALDGVVAQEDCP